MNNLKHLGLKGQGYFCIVKQYKDESNGLLFALKELKRDHYSKDEYRYRLNREISLLKELQGCENIIELLDSGHDTANQKLWYLMPFAKQNLYDFIKRNNKSITNETKFNFVEQIINALKFAHNKSILHRDLSPNNVLVFDSNNKLVLKVCDFGLGKDTESLSYYTSSSASGYGQILYVSPEQRNSLKDASAKSDIYSLGKMVYFIFTAKDPDNIKQFELSSLVMKAIEDNPEYRFSNIDEFEKHFLSLKDLLLNQKIASEHLTLKEIYSSAEQKNWIILHEILVKGYYIDHVYFDYISLVNDLLLSNSNMNDYYKTIGNAIKDFVKTYIDRLNVCYNTFRWPFSEMRTFGIVLIKIIKMVNDDEVKLMCFKHLWYLAYDADQWSVQKSIKEIFNDNYINSAIETQLAEYIIQSETKIEIAQFSIFTLPIIIKSSIINGNKKAIEKEELRKAQQAREIDELPF